MSLNNNTINNDVIKFKLYRINKKKYCKLKNIFIHKHNKDNYNQTQRVVALTQRVVALTGGKCDDTDDDDPNGTCGGKSYE
jgi:hypothetical protein